MKKIIIITAILSFVISCKITKVEIIKPGEEMSFLDIVKNLKLPNSLNEGKTLTIEGKTYNFQKDMGVFFGLYKNENGKGYTDEYIILSPLSDIGASVVSFDEKHKNALDEIINVIGEKGWGWAVSTIFNDMDYTTENISNNAKKGSIYLSQEKITNIQKIIDGLNLTDRKFGTLKKYPETN